MTQPGKKCSPSSKRTQTRMAILLTCLVKIHDWKAWQALQRERLLQPVRQAGARRYQVYRNVNDASQSLVVAELPDHDTAREMGRALNEILALLPGSSADERAWEATGWESIDPAASPRPERRSDDPPHH